MGGVRYRDGGVEYGRMCSLDIECVLLDYRMCSLRYRDGGVEYGWEWWVGGRGVDVRV